MVYIIIYYSTNVSSGGLILTKQVSQCITFRYVYNSNTIFIYLGARKKNIAYIKLKQNK